MNRPDPFRPRAIHALLAEGRPVPPGLEQALAHERLCANCREECQAVQAALGDAS